MVFSVSTARVDITPEPGYWMGGYATESTGRQASGTYSPLSARVLVIWDDGFPNVVVSADVLGMGSQLNAQVRAALPEIPATDLVLLATHTHNGPVLDDAPDPFTMYGLVDLAPVHAQTAKVRDSIVDAVSSALAATRTPVTLDYQVTAQSWSYNRAGLSYVETAVPVLVARDGTGQPRAVLFSYGCHPVSAGIGDLWDGDYPAAAADAIEAVIPGCVALFVPGPAGDQDPDADGTRDWRNRNWRIRDQLGAQLGAAVVQAASGVGRTVTGPFSNSYGTVDLPVDITTTPANLTSVRGMYVQRQNNVEMLPLFRRHAQRMIDAIDAGTCATVVTMPVQVWKLSGSPMLRLAFTGGELVSGYAAYFRGQYGGSNGLMIGGYANTCLCYLPSNELLPPLRSGGSYEGGWYADFPGIAGGSMAVYPQAGHFKAGSDGVEARLIAELSAQLA